MLTEYDFLIYTTQRGSQEKYFRKFSLNNEIEDHWKAVYSMLNCRTEKEVNYMLTPGIG